MQKFGIVAVAAFAALLVTLGFSSAAQAYPEVQTSLTASKLTVNGGDAFSATASANVDCAWTVSWNGEERTSGGTKFVASYTAPTVTKITKVPVTATCAYVATDSSGRASAVPTVRERELTITVLPTASAAAAAPSQNSADLPNTGGPNRVFLLSGLVLLLAGATAVTVARRRAEAELPAQTA
jgi:LPXTG-motif cell wall-anchored protein